MMNFSQLKDRFFYLLEDTYGSEELRAIFYLLLEENNNLSRIQYQLKEKDSVENFLKWQRQIDDLLKGKPVQYVLGKADFCGMQLVVNNHVLIPRPETEELVELILAEIDSTKSISILDVGTGSGCIAIALKKKFKNARVFGLDVSTDALDVARKNAEIQNVNIEWICESIVDFIPSQKFDIIVSNPPYIPENDKNEMEDHVLNHEPHLALFAPQNNPLFFYEKIGDFAKKYLTQNEGKLYFEAHYLWSENVALLFNKRQPTRLLKDMFGKNRFVAIDF